MDVENPRLLVGLIIKLFPDVVILELVETLKDSMTLPDVLPLLRVIVPVPFDGGEVNVKVTLVSIPTAVAPLAGLMELNAKSTVVKL
jgi:hypothetical protein